MSETDLPPEPPTDPESFEQLRARAEDLEHRLNDLQRQSAVRVTNAELKAEAVRAGMIDLDGLKLIDRSQLRFNDEGDLEGAEQLLAEMKRAKPWLFGGTSTSSSATAPPALPPRAKLATEMTDAEYREARSALLRRSA